MIKKRIYNKGWEVNGSPNFICNISKVHFPNGVISNADSSDSLTIVKECYCINCIVVEDDMEIGDPINVSDSYTDEFMKEQFVGLYKRKTR